MNWQKHGIAKSMRDNGETYKKIALELKVSITRARMMVLRVEQLARFGILNAEDMKNYKNRMRQEWLARK